MPARHGVLLDQVTPSQGKRARALSFLVCINGRDNKPRAQAFIDGIVQTVFHRFEGSLHFHDCPFYRVSQCVIDAIGSCPAPLFDFHALCFVHSNMTLSNNLASPREFSSGRFCSCKDIVECMVIPMDLR